MNGDSMIRINTTTQKRCAWEKPVEANPSFHSIIDIIWRVTKCQVIAIVVEKSWTKLMKQLWKYMKQSDHKPNVWDISG